MPTDRERRAQQRLETRAGRAQERTRRRVEARHLHQERRRARDRHDDGETRRRLLEVSARLFADRGLDGVTVRELCRAAGANVAAINYHFGDKLGLYAEVVGAAIEAMRRAHAPSMQPEVGPPEARLGRYIHGQLQRVLEPSDDSWVFRLMQNEVVNPTPGLDRVVREVIRPRTEYVARIVAELMACPVDDPRVGTVVASIQGLPLLVGRGPIVARLLPDWKPTPETIRLMAEQSTRFTLAGIRALAAACPGDGGR